MFHFSTSELRSALAAGLSFQCKGMLSRGFCISRSEIQANAQFLLSTGSAGFCFRISGRMFHACRPYQLTSSSVGAERGRKMASSDKVEFSSGFYFSMQILHCSPIPRSFQVAMRRRIWALGSPAFACRFQSVWNSYNSLRAFRSSSSGGALQERILSSCEVVLPLRALKSIFGLQGGASPGVHSSCIAKNILSVPQGASYARLHRRLVIDW